MIRIALAQVNFTVGDLRGNQARILEFIAVSQDVGVDIVIFPELALTGYPPEDLLFKDYFIKDNLKVLKELAKQVRGITAIVGFVDQRGTKLYNAAAVIEAGKIQAIYHKQELPNYGVFDEKRYFSPGSGATLLLKNNQLMGVNICEDIWAENKVNRAYKQAGVQVLINLSSSPYDFGKLEQREKLLSDRAKQLKAYVCYANLVGGQDELVFDGGSLVIDPKGKVVARGQQFSEDIVFVDLPLISGRKKRTVKKGCIVLSDAEVNEKTRLRKISVPRGRKIERVFKALVLGTRDYLRKNGFQKAVIGLSGGIDSSLVASIACEAVGPENVIGISMPSRFTSKGTRQDARRLAKRLGIEFKEIAIDSIYQTYISALAKEFLGTSFNVAEENLQARIRGNILMGFSNKFGWLVLTTGNKSEVAVGYCTLYGDLSGGFAVIKDIPKTQVYEIARYVNKNLGSPIPASVLKRAPSAELRKNQKDQDSLPAYEKLDRLIKGYVEEHKSLKSLLKINKDKALIEKIVQMIDLSEYKRRQSPPGIKISPRAFGKDWRLPITNKYKEV